jgi:predicted nuclease with TOPRIM domain
MTQCEKIKAFLMENFDYTKHRVDHSVQYIDACLCALSDDISLGDALKERIAEYREKCDEVRKEKERWLGLLEKVEQRERDVNRREEKCKQEEKKYASLYQSACDYLKRAEKYEANLKVCETPEMRDRFRAAYLYSTTAERNIDYQSKASYSFIEGLANILSGGKGAKEE